MISSLIVMLAGIGEVVILYVFARSVQSAAAYPDRRLRALHVTTAAVSLGIGILVAILAFRMVQAAGAAWEAFQAL